MVGAEYPLRKHEVDQEEQQDAGCVEDVRGDGDAGIGRMCRPDETHDQGRDASHGEAEEEDGEDELVPPAQVKLEDEHVQDGRADEEGQ